MKVRLEFQDCGAALNAAKFKQLLISALKDLFGEADAALPLDVLTYEGREDPVSHPEDMQQWSCQIVELSDPVRIL